MNLLIAALVIFGPTGRDSGKSLRDVPYAEPAHAEQHLDFHWPKGAPKATLFFIHGGSLGTAGQRRSSAIYANVCDPFLEAGIACATTDYRLSPDFRWPEIVSDIVRAVVKVRELIGERGGDPDALFLFGHSSGCHLAAVVAMNEQYLATAGLSTSNLAGVIPMGCTLDRYDLALRGATAEAIRDRFMKHPDEVELYGTAQDFIAANPAHYVGPHVPPTLVVLAHGERFFPSILEQGARVVRRLLEQKVPAELVIVPGKHMSSIRDIVKSGDPTFAAVLEFIQAPRAVGDGNK